MFILRKRIYDCESNWKVVSTRLGLDVEKVTTLTYPLLGNGTINTNKLWVGRIENATKTFEITRTAPSFSIQRIFEGNFFALFIHGEVIERESGNTTEVYFKLGWVAFVSFVIFYLFPFLLTIHFITQNNWEYIKELTLWLIFPIIETLLLWVQLNRTEEKVIDLLGVKINEAF
jgi:hypothetical protein